MAAADIKTRRGRHLLYQYNGEALGKKAGNKADLIHSTGYVVIWDAPALVQAKRCQARYMPPGILTDERLGFEAAPAKTKKPAAARAAVKTDATAPAAAAKPDRDRVLSALAALDPSMGYADWLKVGQALHDWDRAAMSLWDDWSGKGGNYKIGETADKWTGFTAGGGITIATRSQWQKPLVGRRRAGRRSNRRRRTSRAGRTGSSWCPRPEAMGRCRLNTLPAWRAE